MESVFILEKQVLDRKEIASMPKPPFKKRIICIPGCQFLKHIAVHTFPLPGGKRGRWESVFIPGSNVDILVAAFTPEERMIVVKMFRFPIENWSIELPGGNAEPGESLAFAAKRELLEETGYTTDDPLEDGPRGRINSGATNVVFRTFLAWNCRKVQAPTLDPVEKLAQLEVLEIKPIELMQAIVQGDEQYDLTISHMLTVLLGQGIISL